MSFLAGKGLPSEGKELGNVHLGDEENRPLTLFVCPVPCLWLMVTHAVGVLVSSAGMALAGEAQLWTSTAGCLLAVPGSSPPQPSTPA